MSPLALLGMAVRGIRRRRLRSLLTAVTTAVAVAVAVATRALVAGLDRGLEEDLGRLGLRTVQVADARAGAPLPIPSAGEPLRDGDADRARAALAAAGVPAVVVVADAAPGVASAAGRPPVAVPVLSVGPDYALTADLTPSRGRFLEAADALPGAEPVCVLDAETADALGASTGDPVHLGVAGSPRRTHRVVGVVRDPFHLRPGGQGLDVAAAARPTLARFLSFRNVYVPRPPGGGPGALLLMAVAERRADASRVHDALEAGLDARRRGLLVWSRGTWVRTMMETVGSQLALVNILWGVILLVALVMIATVGMVAVRERTGEMALRRAEGATRGQIVGLLLTEGALVSAAGALAGIPLGFAAASLLSGYLTWRPAHEPREAALALALGVFVGVAAGTGPALRAARLAPVEGLRAR